MPFGIGIWELLILLLVLLLVFGPKRLPEMGRQLGKGMREFKESVSGSGNDDDDDDHMVHTVDEVAELPPADPATTSAAPHARARHRLLATRPRYGPPDRPAAPEPRRGSEPRRAPDGAPAPPRHLPVRDRSGVRRRVRLPRRADRAAQGPPARGDAARDARRHRAVHDLAEGQLLRRDRDRPADHPLADMGVPRTRRRRRHAAGDRHLRGDLDAPLRDRHRVLLHDRAPEGADVPRSTTTRSSTSSRSARATTCPSSR